MSGNGALETEKTLTELKLTTFYKNIDLHHEKVDQAIENFTFLKNNFRPGLKELYWF